ncbi:MAG: hypothetical protein RIB03_10120 [Henriciella sp.]|uniref:hypothetical protein n=1 Tax=Henriciella sp. TaxID=1968823 RepID=UPI0032EE1879
MFKRGLLALLFIACPLLAGAQSISCGPESELASLVRCTGRAVTLLPEDKAGKVHDELLDTAELVGGTALRREMAEGIRQSPERHDGPGTSYPDYGWQAARELLLKGGGDALVQAAREKSGPVRYGRAEAMLAAGIRAAGYETEGAADVLDLLKPALALRLNDELLSLAGTAGAFEKGDLAHAAAKLAAYRCDLERFERARIMAAAPEAIRYDFWRARITGDRSKLPHSIAVHAGGKDTRPVRQALEGITFLAEVGDCAPGA